MLSAYLNQKAEYHPATGQTNGRGQPIYGAAVTILCRRQARLQNVLTPTGQAVRAQHVYYTLHPVREGDKLDGRVVLAVSIWSDLYGETRGYKAVV